MLKQDCLVGAVRVPCLNVLTNVGIPDPPLSGPISVALRDARKITTLYTHQTDAIAALSEGKDVIVSTSTASGKSVIYQVTPVMFPSSPPYLSMSYFHKRFRCCKCSNRIRELKHFSSIQLRLAFVHSYLYRRFEFFFKALAQDQKGALEGLLGCCRGLESIFVGELIMLCLPVLTSTRSRHMTAIPLEKRDRVSTLHTINEMCTKRWVSRDSRYGVRSAYKHSLSLESKYACSHCLFQDTIHASILPHEERWRRLNGLPSLELLKLIRHPKFFEEPQACRA